MWLRSRADPPGQSLGPGIHGVLLGPARLRPELREGPVSPPRQRSVAVTVPSILLTPPRPRGVRHVLASQMTCGALRVGEPASGSHGERAVTTLLSSFYTSMGPSAFREVSCGPRRPRRVSCWVKSPFSVFPKLEGRFLSLSFPSFSPSCCLFLSGGRNILNQKS